MTRRSLSVIHVNQRDDTATGGAVRVAFELVRHLRVADIDARLRFVYGERGYFGSRLPNHTDCLVGPEECVTDCIEL